MNKEIVSYKPTEAAIADLTTRYKGVVFEVTVAQGMAEAKAAYKDINTHSIILEKAREKEKSESLAYGRFVDSEAKRIAEQLDALRLPIKFQIETETKREERERVAKVQAEIERLAAEDKARKDAEEAKLAAERAQIAKDRAELDRAAAESKAKIEREELAARMIREEADRAARLKIEHEERAARRVREAEEARITAERRKAEAERAAAEEATRKLRQAKEDKLRAEREAEEAKTREVERQKNELLDARAMLETFRKRFGHRKEFAGVVKAIEALKVAA